MISEKKKKKRTGGGLMLGITPGSRLPGTGILEPGAGLGSGGLLPFVLFCFSFSFDFFRFLSICFFFCTHW